MFILWSILLTCLVVWEYKEDLIYRLVNMDLIFTEVSEGFKSYIEFTLLIGILINVPYIVYHIYLFIEPGYFKVELIKISRYINWLGLYLLLLLGSYLFIILPFVITYFSGFEWEGLSMYIRIKDVIDTIELLILGSLLTLVLPIVSIIFGISRRYMIFIILLISSIVTPPDVVSLLLLSFPIIIIVESSLFIYILIKD